MKLIFILIFSLTLAVQTCRKADINLSESIFKHWVHSYEEDTQGTQFYRPASYDFPLSKGREGFEIKKDETFILHRISPVDGTQRVNGKWTIERNNTITIQFNDPAIRGYNLQVLQVSDTLLTIRKTN